MIIEKAKSMQSYNFNKNRKETKGHKRKEEGIGIFLDFFSVLYNYKYKVLLNKTGGENCNSY